MKIYDFLRSPDIAAHCEKIGHVYNPLEIAVVGIWADVPELCIRKTITKRLAMSCLVLPGEILPERS